MLLLKSVKVWQGYVRFAMRVYSGWIYQGLPRFINVYYIFQGLSKVCQSKPRFPEFLQGLPSFGTCPSESNQTVENDLLKWQSSPIIL